MTTPLPCSCIVCKKLTSNLGIASHHNLAHGDPTYREFIAKGNEARRGVPSWNAGLAMPDEQKLKLSVSGMNHVVTQETREKISSTAKTNGKSGGVREGGGRGKKGRYNGIWCDSSWELAFVICAIADGKNISRVLEPRIYVFENKKRKYFPDFCVDGVMYEIKGWKSPQSIAKENPDVAVLQWEEIKPMLERAQSLFGKDITVAYE